MRKVILLLLLLSIAHFSFAQPSTPSPYGNPFTLNRFAGGLKVDTALIIPIRDTVGWMGIWGNLTIQPQTGMLMYRSDGTWRDASYGLPVDTNFIRNQHTYGQIASYRISGEGQASGFLANDGVTGHGDAILSSGNASSSGVMIIRQPNGDDAGFIGSQIGKFFYNSNSGPHEFAIAGIVKARFDTDGIEVIGRVKQSSVTSSMLKADASGLIVAAIPTVDFVTPGQLSDSLTANQYSGDNIITVNNTTNQITHKSQVNITDQSIYTKVQVDSFGHIIYGMNLIAGDIPNIFQSQVYGLPDTIAAHRADITNLYTIKANDNSVVHLFNNESIGGVKTFNQSPIVPLPTTLMQAVPKLYVDGAISDLSSVYIPLSQKGAPNGVAPLDAGGKIDFAYLPATLMIYKGVWSAAANLPLLTDGVGTTGWVYKSNSYGIVNFGSHTDTIYSGDWVIYNGTIWQRTNNSDLVTSVNGQQGIVSLTTDHIPEGLTNLYYTNTRVRNAVSAGGDLSYNPITGVFSYTTPPGLPPTGAAGGDLSGTYPNPSVVDDSHNHTISTLPGIQDSLNARIPMSSFVQLNQNFANADLSATSNRDHDFSNYNLNIFATKWTIEGATEGLHLASFTSNGLVLNGSTTANQPAYLKTDSISGSGKSFQFPNSSGTLALRSDIPSLAGYWQYSDTISTLATRHWVNTTFIPLSSYNTLNENFANTNLIATGNRTHAFGANSLSIGGSNWSIDASSSVVGLTSTSTLGIGIKASATTSGTALLKTDSIPSGTRTFQFGPTSGRLAITADLPTSANYIVNSTSLQSSSNFNISGSGRVNNMGVGVDPTTSSSLIVGKNITGNANSFSLRQEGTVQSDVSQAYGFYNLANIASGFTLGTYNHFTASQGTIGSGSAMTNQWGFRVASNFIGGTVNGGFYGEIPAGTNRWNLYMSGTAQNYLAGKLGIGVPVPMQALHVNGVIRQTFAISSMLKADAGGDIVAAVAGTDYIATEVDPKYIADTSKIMMYRWGLTTGNDLNTITIPGYYSANNTISATLVNAPQSGSPMILEVWRNTLSGIYVMQRATYNGAISYRRFSIDGGANWGGWTVFGSVSNFSAGDLSPLFTTTEATTTTTPALSFSLSNAGANTFFGNNTGSSAAPSYTAMQALTKTDDANVTLTLGGTPATSLLKAVSMTLGWTGQLSVARGGTGASTLTGYVKGNGTSAFTASATIPYSDISGTPSLSGYELLSNKATSLASPDNTKYPTTLAVSTDLATKEPTIAAGTSGQYWRGDKTWQTIDWLTGNQSITWTGTGDVTGTASGATSISPALTIANNAVSNAKAADMATQTFKGRTTAGTGDPEDLTIAQAKTMLNLTGTNTGDQTITLTGDVTGSGTGSFATAIAAGAIVNADVNSSAAIAHSKMAALTASRAMVTDASGFASASSVTATELGYSSGLTAGIQTQLNGKEPTITLLPVSKGGTGIGTLTGVTIGNGTSAFSAVAGTANQLLRRNAANTSYEFFTPTYLTSYTETDPVYTASISDQMMYKAIIPASVNLNSYTTTGKWYQNNNANAASGTNYPTPFAGMLEVTNGASGDMIFQTYQSYYGGGDNYYQRSFYAGIWSNWSRKIADNEAVTWGTWGGGNLMNGYPGNSIMANNPSNPDAPYAGSSFTWNAAQNNTSGIYSAQMFIGIPAGTGTTLDEFYWRTNQQGGPGWPGTWLQVASRQHVSSTYVRKVNEATGGGSGYPGGTNLMYQENITKYGYANYAGTTVYSAIKGTNQNYQNNGLGLSFWVNSPVLAAVPGDANVKAMEIYPDGAIQFASSSYTGTTGRVLTADTNGVLSLATTTSIVGDSYIKNGTTPQTADFSITGDGEIDGNLTQTNGIASVEVLGVGVSNPAEALEVQGNAQINGNLKTNNIYPATGASTTFGGDVVLSTVASSLLKVDVTGKVEGADPGIDFVTPASLNVSGAYTPTLTNAGTGTVTPEGFTYLRNGDIIHVSGRISCSGLTAGGQIILISLPVSSAMSNSYDVTGVATGTGLSTAGNFINADASADKALFNFFTSGTTATAYVSFQYLKQ